MVKKVEEESSYVKFGKKLFHSTPPTARKAATKVDVVVKDHIMGNTLAEVKLCNNKEWQECPTERQNRRRTAYNALAKKIA